MNNPPHFKGFRPIGLTDEKSPVILNYEEYEALRLSDFEFYGQVEAAQIMDVSRPTYARIYESARRKIAQAFVLGKAIVFEGGKVYFDSEWYACNKCGCWFNHPQKEFELKHCALCGSADIEQCSDDVQQNSNNDICVCQNCGTEKLHIPGLLCQKEICPKCNSVMIRRGAPHYHKMN
jgi:predicted DNA-binding protein (UPF0251 family)